MEILIVLIASIDLQFAYLDQMQQIRKYCKLQFRMYESFSLEGT
jgi:hypothetical protein